MGFETAIIFGKFELRNVLVGGLEESIIYCHLCWDSFFFFFFFFILWLLVYTGHLASQLEICTLPVSKNVSKKPNSEISTLALVYKVGCSFFCPLSSWIIHPIYIPSRRYRRVSIGMEAKVHIYTHIQHLSNVFTLNPPHSVRRAVSLSLLEKLSSYTYIRTSI